NTENPEKPATTCFVHETVISSEAKHQPFDTDFVLKLRVFEEYARQGRALAKWGFRDFWVTTTMPTTARSENMCAKLRAQGLNHKKFWFTDYSRYSLDDPGRVLGKIFATPYDYTQPVLYSLVK